MIKNYILIAIRNLRKNFSYAAINIAGLALGLATCIFLTLWIFHELSYDRFHEKSDRLYRSSLEYSSGGQTAKTAVSPTALLPTLLNFPEVEYGARVYNPSDKNPFIVRYEDKLFQETRFYFADSAFFQLFSFKLVAGNPRTALNRPNQVVVTQSTALRYFGNEDPIGKAILINDNSSYEVTGVIQDVPDNSLLNFDFIGSFISLRVAQEDPIWWSANYQTYVTLHPGADVLTLAEKTNRHVREVLNIPVESESEYVRYNFSLMRDIYLHSTAMAEPERTSDIKYVYIFAAIGLLVLIIAAINFINLATARATERAKEVSLRKVVGAARRQLFFQFLGESILITLLAFLLSMIVVQLTLPFFNHLTGKVFTYQSVINFRFLAVAAAGLLLVALLAGAYPALIITSFQPASVLKGSFKFSGRGVFLRKTLVVMQFSTSLILMIGTLVIMKQLDYIQSKNIGYDRENVVVLPLDPKTRQAYESFKTELLRSGVATEVGRATESPVQIVGGYSMQRLSTDQPILTAGLPIDDGYIPALGMNVIAGRNLSKADLALTNADTLRPLILNESAIELLNLSPEEAVGTTIIMDRPGEIVGVVKDFHFASLHKAIGPLVMFPSESNFSYIFVRTSPGNIKQSLETIKQISANVLPHRPFEYDFVDQQFSSLYRNELQMTNVFLLFACISILIASLGLFGLIAFTATQKTKEIGVRKVLGASTGSILILIVRDFMKLVLIAVAIGIPIAYYVMNEWLAGFAYKTQIGAGIAIVAAALCFIIALTTAGYQALRAAWINPVDTLRND